MRISIVAIISACLAIHLISTRLLIFGTYCMKYDSSSCGQDPINAILLIVISGLVSGFSVITAVTVLAVDYRSVY